MLTLLINILTLLCVQLSVYSPAATAACKATTNIHAGVGIQYFAF